MDFDSAKNYIRDKLPREDLFLQLAEEASELSMACSKYIRIIRGNNPSPKTQNEAFDNVLEELTDVLLVSDVLRISAEVERAEQKAERWVGRLLSKRGKDGSTCD